MPSFDEFLNQYCVEPKLRSREMDAFHRVLLCTDGTVTEAMQAFHLESMRVELIAQRRTLRADADLQTTATDPVLERRVALFGAVSGTRYLGADSLIALRGLSAEMIEALIEGSAPIGSIISRYRLETRREILRCGQLQAGARSGMRGPTPAPPGLPDPSGLPDGETLFRTYRIICRGAPIMLITEYFPRELRVDPGSLPR